MERKYFGFWLVFLVSYASMAATSGPSLSKRLEIPLSTYNRHLSAQLSPDGEWLIYSFYSQPLHDADDSMAEVTIGLRGTRNGIEKSYAAGAQRLGGGDLKMSSSGRWFAFRKAPGVHTSKLEEPVVVVVETATGRRREFAARGNFSFAGMGQEWIVVQGHPVGKEDVSFNLTLQRLTGEKRETFGSVRAYVFNPLKTRMAWHDEQGIHVYDFVSGHMQMLERARADYRYLSWSGKGNALAFLRAEDSGYTLMAFTRLNERRARKTVLTPTEWQGFPKGYEIDSRILAGTADAEVLSWREDEEGLFFGIRAVNREDSVVKEAGVPDLILWHWQDRMPPQEHASTEWRPTNSYLSFTSIVNKRFIQLADSALATVQPHARGRFVLGFDTRAYDDPILNSAGISYAQRDYSVVDLRTGSHTTVAKGLWVTEKEVTLTNCPRLSPDGLTVLYQDNAGDYYVYEVSSGKRRNLTAGLPTRFYNKENLQTHRHLKTMEAWLEVQSFQGWTQDSAYALVSDYRDVWALPLRGGEAINLTGNGWLDDIVYERTRLQSWSRMRPSLNELKENTVDLSQPIYFQARDRKNGNMGLARYLPETGRLEALSWEKARVRYYKADRAPVYFSWRGTASDPPDHYLLDATWKTSERLTDINPLVRELSLREPLYLSYAASNGEIYHGVLHLPLDAKLPPPYPTIVEIYESLDGIPHTNLLSTRYSQFLRDGYAFLYLHISPRLDQPGQAALEAVSAAVEAAVASGIADRDRLALTGHSYGGYETSYVIARTNLFKAAVSRAGVSNLWSGCNRVYSSGESRSPQCAAFQPYMSGWWWDSLQTYLENSPLYHARDIQTPLLLAHGDRDSAVPFMQAVELYNTLRLMDKPVVLLQYVGADHGLVGTDAKIQSDLFARIHQFFDHFLKGAPAPDWWAKGTSYAAGQAPSPSYSTTPNK